MSHSFLGERIGHAGETRAGGDDSQQRRESPRRANKPHGEEARFVVCPITFSQ